MKRLRLLSFIVFAPILFILACKKHKLSQPPAYVSNQLKSYFGYKPGSYWIYADSGYNGQTDSLVVYNYQDTSISIYNVSTETITVSMYAYTKSNNHIIDSAEWDIVMQQNNTELLYDGFPAHNHLAYLPFTEGIPFALIGGAYNNTVCNSVVNYAISYLPYYTIDSNVIDSNTYSNVYQMHYLAPTGSCTMKGINDWIYTTQAFGIIKMNLNNAYVQKVMELKYCHIIR